MYRAGTTIPLQPRLKLEKMENAQLTKRSLGTRGFVIEAPAIEAGARVFRRYPVRNA
jgi:hypothetical protein